MFEPTLSIVTGTVDRPESFGRMLDSVVAHTPPVDWELLVSDGSKEPYGLSLPASVVMYPDGELGGWSKAYNSVCRLARGKYVAWLNDDAKVQPGWAERGVAFMERFPKVGLGCLYWCDHRPPWKVDAYHGFIYPNFGIIRREVGEKVGWFPEEIRCYGADVMIALNVLLAGHAVSPIPGARVLHHRVEDGLRRRNMSTYERDLKFFERKFGELRTVAAAARNANPAPEGSMEDKT